MMLLYWDEGNTASNRCSSCAEMKEILKCLALEQDLTYLARCGLTVLTKRSGISRRVGEWSSNVSGLVLHFLEVRTRRIETSAMMSKSLVLV